MRVNVEPRWRRLVEDLLARHAPRPCRVLAFGSRVKGRARRFSDLDLAIDCGRRLALGETGPLEDALEESDLPWRVDVVDLVGCAPAFRVLIEAEAVPFWSASG